MDIVAVSWHPLARTRVPSIKSQRSGGDPAVLVCVVIHVVVGVVVVVVAAAVVVVVVVVVVVFGVVCVCVLL